MPLIYVTGIPGSGKSAVQAVLIRRGYNAHDVDEPGIGGAHNKSTNQIVVMPTVDERTPEWFAEHSWRMIRPAIEDLKKQDGLVFLCGTAGNEDEVWDLFDKVICLTVDDETLKQRLATREDNDYGKSDYELNKILASNATSRQEYEALGAVSIDASSPLNDVVDNIIELTKSL